MPALRNLSTALGPQVDKRSAAWYIVPLEPGTDAPIMDEIRMFQYNPESLQDTKQNNYQQKEVPGGSLPLYQWVAGGERLISFSVLFTNDIEPLGELGEYEGESALTGQLRQIQSAGIENRNVDISGACAWLRQFIYPKYQEEIPNVVPPRKLFLVIPKTYIDVVTCVMTQCDVTINACWPGGAIREAEVQLSFAEVAQSKGAVVFPGSGRPRSTTLPSTLDQPRLADSLESVAKRYTLSPSRDLKR